MIRRFTLFLQIKLANGSISHLIDENGSFRFIENDILKVGPRVKHNIYIKDYAEARALSYRLQNVSNDYQKQVLKDKPSIYWLLSERRGSTVAHNYGTIGERMNGVYSGEEVSSDASPLLHPKINRSTYFDSRKKCRITTLFCRDLSPTDAKQPLTLEVWAKVTGGRNSNRTAVMTG